MTTSARFACSCWSLPREGGVSEGPRKRRNICWSRPRVQIWRCTSYGCRGTVHGKNMCVASQESSRTSVHDNTGTVTKLWLRHSTNGTH